MNLETIQRRLDSLQPDRFVVIEQLDASSALIKDVTTSLVLTRNVNNFISSLKKNPNRFFMMDRDKGYTEEDVRALLKFNGLCYELLEWSGEYTKSSVFKNTENHNVFKASLKHLLQNVKSGRRVPGASKEEERQRARETMQARYGGVGNASPTTSAKIRKTNLERLGVENPFSSTEVQEKIRETNVQKYGVPYLLADKERHSVGMQKRRENGVASGSIKLIGGVPVYDIAEAVGCSPSSLYTNDFTTIKDVEEWKDSSKTSIELSIKQLLDSNNIAYVYNNKLEGTNYRPDFVLTDYNVVIECDGLYWHSDATGKDKNYHIARKQEYVDLGYFPLFFREDEIRTKLNIVESIIRNKAKVLPRIFARKTTVKELTSKEASKFLNENHLMGRGAGSAFALMYDNSIVAVMQVKWKSLASRTLEISRFSTALNVNVVGAFSKLLSAAYKDLEPSQVLTFIDNRYGSGAYLQTLGFSQGKTHPSFKWTKGFETLHRLKFKGNSGYEAGYSKIWDCGQTPWIKVYGK